MQSQAGEHRFLFDTAVIVKWLTCNDRIQELLLVADWILIALAAFYATGVRP